MFPNRHPGWCCSPMAAAAADTAREIAFVADVLFKAGLGTLLLDLLTPAEELDRKLVFDIELLADRLIGATEWLATQPETASCRVGYFGASTGAGAALWAAASGGTRDRRGRVARWSPRPRRAPAAEGAGAHPAHRGQQRRPTLRVNRHAQARLRCPCSLIVVQGAGHLFEEPGTLNEVAALARDWFTRYLLRAEQVRTARAGSMNTADQRFAGSDPAAEILSLARPLADPEDLQPLVDHIGGNRLVCIGEASHGTSEFYRWRAS